MPSARIELSLETPLQRACREMERRLREAKPCSAKLMLREAPELATNKESALELIYTEFVVR